MSTYADVNVRVFRTKSEEDASRLTRKRSCGRLKSYQSATDFRAWSCNNDERRRHILQLLRSYKTTLGNYVPFHELLKLLAHMKNAEDVALLHEAIDALEKVDHVLSENEDLVKKLSSTEAEKNLLEDEKDELKGLLDCLKKAGGDLKKENKCLKDEIGRLLKIIQDLEKDKAKLQGDQSTATDEINDLNEQLANLKGQLEALKGQLQEQKDKNEQLKEQNEKLETEKSRAVKDRPSRPDIKEEEKKKKEEEEKAAREKKKKEEEEKAAREDKKKQAEDEVGELGRGKAGEGGRQEIGGKGSEKSPEEEEEEERKRKREEEEERKRKQEEEKRKQEEEEEKRKQEDEEKKKQEDEEKRKQAEEKRKAEEEGKRKPAEEKKRQEGSRESVESKRRVSKMEKELQSCQEELDYLTQERDCLRKEVERLKRAENELIKAEAKIQELLCEVEMLQCCLHKQDKEACELVQTIQQLQVDVDKGKVLEFKLREVCKRRDQLKYVVDQQTADMNSIKTELEDKKQKLDQLEPLKEKNNCLMEKYNCLMVQINHLKTIECQKKELEEEHNKLSEKVQNLMQLCQKQELEIVKLSRKLSQQECGVSSECGFSNDSDLQCKMKELENKVCQQATIIMSQRKCLLEQHKYIVDQEQVRNSMQCRIKEQCQKRAELVHERNVLRSEVMFLSNRLKSYLEKIKVLEKSIEQFFRGQKKKESCSRKPCCCSQSSGTPSASNQLPVKRRSRSTIPKLKPECCRPPVPSTNTSSSANMLTTKSNISSLNTTPDSNDLLLKHTADSHDLPSKPTVTIDDVPKYGDTSVSDKTVDTSGIFSDLFREKTEVSEKSTDMYSDEPTKKEPCTRKVCSGPSQPPSSPPESSLLSQVKTKLPEVYPKLKQQCLQSSSPDSDFSPKTTCNSDNLPQYYPPPSSTNKCCTQSSTNKCGPKCGYISDAYRYDSTTRSTDVCLSETTIDEEDYIPPRSVPSKASNTHIDEYDSKRPYHGSLGGSFLNNLSAQRDKIISGFPRGISDIGSGRKPVGGYPTKLKKARVNSPPEEDFATKDSQQKRQERPSRRCPC